MLNDSIISPWGENTIQYHEWYKETKNFQSVETKKNILTSDNFVLNVIGILLMFNVIIIVSSYFIKNTSSTNINKT